VKISSDRTAHRSVRCRTGTFEWRYGRNQTALFHAGNQFAILWERAGIAVASSADFLRGTASDYPTGISDGRVAAIDAFARNSRKARSLRLRAADDVLRGRHDCDGDCEVGTVLNNDLRQCAVYFKLLGHSVRKIRSASEMT